MTRRLPRVAVEFREAIVHASEAMRFESYKVLAEHQEERARSVRLTSTDHRYCGNQSYVAIELRQKLGVDRKNQQRYSRTCVCLTVSRADC